MNIKIGDKVAVKRRGTVVYGKVKDLHPSGNGIIVTIDGRSSHILFSDIVRVNGKAVNG